jgi:hypothetical protein
MMLVLLKKQCTIISVGSDMMQVQTAETLQKEWGMNDILLVDNLLMGSKFILLEQ